VGHLDQYTGKPLIDMSFADYGPLGKGLEWGINVHMGQEFGLANQLFMLAVCIAIVLMSVSAGVMWWKRRPRGGFGVPPLPSDRRVLRGVVGILAVGGVLFPLVGGFPGGDAGSGHCPDTEESLSRKPGMLAKPIGRASIPSPIAFVGNSEGLKHNESWQPAGFE
jgi:hypothetical protein